MAIYIKDKKRKIGEFQFFMHQFVEAAIRNGIKPLPEFASQNIFIRLFRKLSPILRLFPKKKRCVIIPSDGSRLYYNCRPYYRYNIIPFLWDIWLVNREILLKDIKKLRIKVAFVTSKQNKELIERETGIRCYYIPEGIDIADYKKGAALINRKGDLYELGRQHPLYHKIVVSLINIGLIENYYGHQYDEHGRLVNLAFASAEELLSNINKIKIVVCFPQCDTHPERAGEIETLTQRYWECMLSGCLIIGRAPMELIDLIGYNPVIEVDWDAPEEQLKSVLDHIEQYQELVDKNYKTALYYASWDNRIELLKNILAEDNITI